jgi:hypothetical protein
LKNLIIEKNSKFGEIIKYEMKGDEVKMNEKIGKLIKQNKITLKESFKLEDSDGYV